LRVDVQDQAGNPAQASRSVFRDDEAPVVVVLAPADGSVLTRVADVDGDLENGIQVNVQASVDGVEDGEQPTACLSNNDVVLAPCPGQPAAVLGGRVEFPRVSLVPGRNVLLVAVTDGAGNIGTGQATVGLEIDAPTVEVLPLDADNCLAVVEGGVQVTVLSSAADGSPATLLVDDLAVGQGEIRGGQVVFTVNLAPDRVSSLVARVAEPGRDVGISQPMQVRIHSSAGELTFVEPVDGALIGLAAPSTGSPGYMTTVRLLATGIVAGQQATLDVDCPGREPQGTTAQVGPAGNDGVAELAFPDVAFPDDAQCTLVVSSTNCADLSTKTQISITIDRIPPMLEFVQPSDGAVLTFQDDANPQQDGLQTSVVVRVSGVPVGTEVLLRVADRGQLVARSEEEGLTYFRDVTIPDGVGIPLRAEAADAAGNVTTLSILLAEVIGTEPSIAYFAPNRDTSWKAADDLDGSTPGFQQEFVFVTAHLSEGTELKLCSNLAAAGSDCGRAGFRAVATGSVQSDRVTIRRATLAQGTHEVYGEARYGVNRRAESISLRVSIDATVPRLLQLAVTSDRPPLGVLNASEDQVPGGPTLQARVEAAFADDPADPFDQIGDGRMITLFTNNPAPRTQLGRVAVAANALAFPSVNLTEGTHLLSLEGTDVQGNPLPADSPKVQVLVDITPPQLSFSTPLDGQVLLAFDDVDPLAEGLQLDVTLICSGAGVGQPLALSVNEMPRQPPASSREGLVTIPKVTLPEGAVRLAAALSDPAGNSKQASVQVTVDSLPPELAILDPAPGTTLGLAADLDPARGGLQIDVRVQVSGAPAGAPVYVESSSSGQVSDAAVVGANGQAVLRCTLPPGEQELIAWASDELGNEGRSTAVPVTVEIIGCGLFFVAPAGSPVLLGRKDDINGDPQDGAQINVRFAAANLDCDGRQAELLRDGQEWAVTELQAGQASFASLTFLDGTEVLLQGRVADSLTGEKRIRTDLTPPAGSFARPAANPAVLLAADDLDRERAGLQYTFQLNLAGTTKGRITLRSSIDGELLRLPDAQRPQAIGEGLVTLPETSRPLSNGAHQLTATIEDEAGNSASFAIQAEVDVVPPELGELTTEVLDQRLPQIRLSWTAPGDDGEQGGAVSSYDLRYAGYALNRDNLAAACVLPLDEELVAPGQLQEVLAEGPGPDGACRLRLEGSYYFAAVAVDRRGNRSEPSFTGPLEIRFRKKIVSEEATTAFGNFLARLGDVDGDRLPDLGVSSYQDLRAWLILGRQDLAQGSATPIQLPAGPPPTFFGLAIMTVGDVSGDGIGDFAVNAQGSVYLYLGRADGVAAAAPVTRLAVAAGNFPEVSAAGNFDGEGPGDLVIGDFMANGGKGAAWIVLGRPAGEWPAQLDLGLDRQTNDGLRVMALEGNAAGSIGDRMGPLYRFCSGEDSRDDIGLSGFRFSANKGQALVLCGRTLQEMPAGRNLGFADAWLIPSPSAAAGQFGTRLSGGTDLTGDGHPDLVVSAPGIRTLYIYPGNAAGVPALHTSLSGAGLDQYGRFVSQPGDVDGNGLNDLLVATKPSAAQNEPNGLAIIYLAQEVGGQPAFGARDPQLRGEQGSSFGSSLAAPGDMNDDGAPDLAIGSPGNKRVYLFY
ncbi:MAG: hypothetical protein FJ125_00395, partial [Deltaproteobacteria bacterium]|nr:hypothetical protein [Deltaproteobacteria bacterium]